MMTWVFFSFFFLLQNRKTSLTGSTVEKQQRQNMATSKAEGFSGKRRLERKLAEVERPLPRPHVPAPLAP